MKVLDYTLLEYFSLKSQENIDKVNYYLRFGKFEPIDTFDTGGHKKRSFGFIKLLQFKFGNGSFTWLNFVDYLAEELNIKKETILNTSVYKCKQQIEYLLKDIDTVNNNEREALAGYQDPDSEAAGISRFNKFGNFPQIDKLADGNVLLYDEIEKQPYLRLFNKLYYDAEYSEYQRKLQKIRSKKNK